MSMFTGEQISNLRTGHHPDCGDGDPCKACGAREAPGGGACPGKIADLPHQLWMAAWRHDHNADPSRVLFPSRTNDAGLLDRAARAVPAWERR
ncbi:hypothetical protein [Caulobacter segnis]